MLPARSRLTRRQDFAEAFRRGPANRRAATAHFILHARLSEKASAGAHEDFHGTRVGVVVSRAVGNAVVRNRVKRRLRSAVRECRAGLPAYGSVVIRALPSAADSSYATLCGDLSAALSRISRSGGRA